MQLDTVLYCSKLRVCSSVAILVILVTKFSEFFDFLKPWWEKNTIWWENKIQT